MTPTNPGHHAHPIVTANGRFNFGLTKREYFAAHILAAQVMLSHEVAVSWAVARVDALIEELNKDLPKEDL